jgi:hypothetical protein
MMPTLRKAASIAVKTDVRFILVQVRLIQPVLHPIPFPGYGQ